MPGKQKTKEKPQRTTVKLSREVRNHISKIAPNGESVDGTLRRLLGMAEQPKEGR